MSAAGRPEAAMRIIAVLFGLGSFVTSIQTGYWIYEFGFSGAWFPAAIAVTMIVATAIFWGMSDAD